LFRRKITQQHSATQLQLTDEIFRLLVEGVKDYAIFLLDPTGNVATWNQGAERIKGYKAQEIIGQHFSRFYPREVDRDWKLQAKKVGIPTKVYVSEKMGRLFAHTSSLPHFGMTRVFYEGFQRLPGI